MGYMVTKAGLVNVDNRISTTTSTLTANQSGASYQWFNCDTESAISGATNRDYNPTSNGNYAVEITSGSCIERSDCYSFSTLGIVDFDDNVFSMYPNPVKEELHIDLDLTTNLTVNIFDISGKIILIEAIQGQRNVINLKSLSKGMYFVNVKSSERSRTYKIVKE
jgi:hypothetical protein